MIEEGQPAIPNQENKGIKILLCKIWAMSQKSVSLPFFFSFLNPHFCHLHSYQGLRFGCV